MVDRLVAPVEADRVVAGGNTIRFTPFLRAASNTL